MFFTSIDSNASTALSIHQYFSAENRLWEAKTSFLCTNVPTFQSQVHLGQHKLTLTMVHIIQFCLSDLHLSEKSKCPPTLICLRVAWDHCTTSNLVDGVECYSIYTWIYFMPIWFKLTLATDEPDDNERGIGPWRVHPSVDWSAPNDLPSYHSVSWEDTATLPAPMMVASVVNAAVWLVFTLVEDESATNNEEKSTELVISYPIVLVSNYLYLLLVCFHYNRRMRVYNLNCTVYSFFLFSTFLLVLLYLFVLYFICRACCWALLCFLLLPTFSMPAVLVPSWWNSVNVGLALQEF